MTHMSREELTAQLTRHRNFAGLSPADFDALLDIAELRPLRDGETIFKLQEVLEGGYILVAGRIEQTELPWPGRTLRRQFFAPGSLFGLGGFIRGWPSHRDAVALEDSFVLFVDRGAFGRLIEAGSTAAFRVVDALLDLYVQDVQSVNQHLDEIYNRPAETLALLRHHAARSQSE